MSSKKMLRIMASVAMSAVLAISSIGTYKVFAEQAMVPLFKYSTDPSAPQVPILLHDKQIYVPKNPILQKRQFRSAWVSTVTNIDFPSKAGLTQEAFKAEYLEVLKKFEELNMNAVTLQVRPMNDAFYKSNLNPWSQYLTGVQGKDPGWDPLTWMIEETHNRNMEFHAWFNPYRVAQAFKWDMPTEQVLQTELAKLADSNFAKMHPEYLVRFDNKLIMNPGIPAVQKFVEDSIMEVVKNYDIDAVHFDDYFYPYKVTRSVNGVSTTFIFGDRDEDKATFEQYRGSFTDIKAWRRNNIDTLINNVSKAIKKEKSYVKFGISPFGIWGHAEKHPAGSPEGEGSHTPIGSSASYDDIYADTRKWVEEGFIDYITPQIYWSFAQPAAPYGELADWWANVVKGTNCHLYIGHANYKHTDNSSWDTDWKNPQEIPNQLKFNSIYEEIKGSSFFSLKSLKTNKFGETNIIKNEYFNQKALVPAMLWLDDKAPHKPVKLEAKASNDKGIELKWEDTNKDSAYYVVYRFEGNKIGDLEDPSNIIDKVRRNKTSEIMSFVDHSADKGKKYTYAVTAVDRLHNESKPRIEYYPSTSEVKSESVSK